MQKDGTSINGSATAPLLDKEDGPNQSYDNVNNFTESRSYLERTFGEMGEGSIRGSIFTICSIAVGAGALSLPYVVSQLGWVLGGSMLTIAAFTSVWSLNIIVQCANRTQVMDYSKLCAEVLGRPGKIAAQFCQISYLFGACCSF